MNGIHMRLRHGVLTCVTLVLLALAGCRNSVPVSNDDDYATGRIPGRNAGSLAGAEGFSFSSGDKKGTAADAGSGTLGVNAYLWRGALDTLSFMPLASADPFGGVIITDWYQPTSGTGERFKATAYILGRQLRADGVKVALFRQVQQGGQWVDAPVSPSTTSEVENKVLFRARELRAASGG
jgi:hypothetical protein